MTALALKGLGVSLSILQQAMLTSQQRHSWASFNRHALCNSGVQ
jgi:hypothetical protein